jgi:hypothetical protein
VFNTMTTPPANLFALLNDDVEDGSHDIEVAVAVREEQKKVEATEKKKQSQQNKAEEKKKEQSRARARDLQNTEFLRAKRLVLPRSVIRSQIVFRKEKPEEEAPQHGKTVPSNGAAAQKHDGGHQRSNGERTGGRVNGNNRGYYRRANGGNGRRNVEENNHGGSVLDEEGFQMVCSRGRRNGGRSVFSDNKIGLAEETQAGALVANQESGKEVQSNGGDEEPREEKKNSNEENRAANAYKGKESPSNKEKNSLEEKKKKKTREVQQRPVFTLKEYEIRLQKTKGGSPGNTGQEIRNSIKVNGTESEKESLDKVLKSKFVYTVRR